jgi:N-acetylmuramoyl-L-alanine amidase
MRWLLVGFFIFIYPTLGVPNAVEIIAMRWWNQTNYSTRLIFELSAPVTHNLFTLKSPYRLVIDFTQANLLTKLISPPADQQIVNDIRSAPRPLGDLRIVLDLAKAIRTKSFLLKPEGSIGSHRLIVDISASPPMTEDISPQKATILPTATVTATKPSRTILPLSSSTNKQPVQTFKPSLEDNRDIIIAIDAGHGGIDPGAIGLTGVYEKDVVLAIALELANLIAKEQGMKAVLIRNGDYFIPLRKRIDLARQYQADLFVSLHADAYWDNDKVSGSSVYMLSHGGASSEAARWLAEKENAADLLGGIKLSDKDELLASVLLDLSQAGTLEASAHAAQRILSALRTVTKNHLRAVQRAGFMVLRAPDIPSVLVETGFISSAEEEQRLNTPEYRQQLALALFEGIKDYFTYHAPPGTLLAHREEKPSERKN